MAWHDASCPDLHLEWEDGRPGCRTCQRRAPELTPIHPISPPAPPLHTSRSQLVCTWPPRVFSNLIRDEDQGYAAASGHDYNEEQKLRAFICANIDEWTASHASQEHELSLSRNQESLQQQMRPEPMLHKIYSRLPETDSIRLLCVHGSKIKSDPIHCSLLVCGLRDHSRPIFEALSYTWADSNGNSALCETIFIGPNYDTCLVTKNCMAALQRYRIAVDRLIWVDAICINQFDLEERGQQVSLMREIYESASRVLIYADDESAKRVPIPDFTDDNHMTSVDPRFILQIPYFSRIWVIQEVQLSNTATLTIGDVTIDWGLFLRYLSKYRDKTLEGTGEWTHEGGGEGKYGYGREWKRVGEREDKRWVQHWVEYLNIERSDMSIISLLGATLHCRCGDARDRLYGLLGLTGRDERSDLPVDYGINVQQLYTGLAMYWLTEWGSWPLQSYILDLAFLPKTTPLLPSWVPDWESLSNIETSYEHSPSASETLGFKFTDLGRSSSGLNWRWPRKHGSQYRWTLEDVCRPQGTARPLREAGIMVVDAVHLLSVLKDEIHFTDINGNPLYGLGFADTEDLDLADPGNLGRSLNHMPREDAELHILVNWNRACLLKLHADKVYSLDSPCEISCGLRGIPTGDPWAIRQDSPHHSHREKSFNGDYLSEREAALAGYSLIPGFRERGNISAISGQLAGLEVEIVEGWLTDILFFSTRAGSAFAKSTSSAIIQDHWKEHFPLATAASQQSDWLSDAHVAESQEPVEMAAMREQRKRVMAFVFENAALGFDITGSAHLELTELVKKIYKPPDSHGINLLDAGLSFGIERVRKTWYWRQILSMGEMHEYLDGVVHRHTNACKNFQPPYLAILQINPFLLPVSVRTMGTLSWSTNHLEQETVRVTVGDMIRNAVTLIEDLKIDDKFTLEQNINILWISVLTIEMIARLRGVLQQRLVLKAIADKMHKVQKIYLI